MVGTVLAKGLPTHAKGKDLLGAVDFAAKLEFVVAPEFADIIEIVGAENMEYIG